MPPAFFRRSLVRIGVALFAAAFACASMAAAAGKKSPAWSELTPAQQQILKPLAPEWNTLDAIRRAKWLGIAKRYPQMTPTGQKRVQKRMAAWMKLSPEQRRKAREQYQTIGKLPPKKRKAVNQKWAEYQRLPPDVKKRLAAEHPGKTDKIEPRKRKKAAKKAKTPAPTSIAPVLPPRSAIPVTGN